MSQSTRGWTLNDWQQAYRNQHLQPAVLAELLAELSDSDPAWISLASAPNCSTAVIKATANKNITCVPSNHAGFITR